MIKPDNSANETIRLQQLRSLRILDTPAEERFDRLTRLAKRLLNVPIALVSLVDEHRQWFNSSIGLSVSETSRETSFCGHAILDNDCLTVADTKHDPRFADNPLVMNEPFIRFYAGCPLKYLDGSKMGTLCVIDTIPRILNDNEIEALRDLAELAERELIAVQLATMDDLTGISNRRGFSVLAQNSLNLCTRHNIPASLVFFDINEFKKINDSFGHPEGDRALTSFSELLIQTFRDSDVIARLGGDEFVVLLTNTTVELAEELIDRFQQSLDTYNLQSNSGYDISFCSGIVETDKNQQQSIDILLSKADSMMYEKKHQLLCATR